MRKHTFFKKSTFIKGFGKNLALNTHIFLGLNTRKLPLLIKKREHKLLFDKIKENPSFLFEKRNKEDPNLLLDTSLQSFTNEQIAFILNLRNFRGIRHLTNLPCRGQRTRTNSKTNTKAKNKKNYL
jgi:ribosomal protein S13